MRKPALWIGFLLLTILAGGAYADKPQKPPKGMGKYILFLKQAPPVPPGQSHKKIVPPDVAKLGGAVLQKTDQYQVIHLPVGAAKQLRKDENVDYLQRIWFGESREEWNATEAEGQGFPGSMGMKTDSLTETASWGPKNYSYDGSGNIKQIAEYDGSGTLKQSGTEQYTYDAVSRLKQAVVNGTTESYGYDAFGNLISKQTGSNAASALNVDPSSNRVANQTYDIAGNVVQDAHDEYFYDSLGMLTGMSAAGGAKRMYYTADDERMGYTLGSFFARWMVRDFEGRPLREFRTAQTLNWIDEADWIWVEDYMYAGGQLVAGETAGPYGTGNMSTIPVDRRRRHYHLDHLGSVRLITTENGGVALGVHNYYPFGLEQSAMNQEEANFGGNAAIRPEPLRFTGHERDFNGLWNIDNTQYLDYMHARYYDPGVGRFLSVDPMLDVEKALVQPQRWNRYSYVENNPINRFDPDGRQSLSGAEFIVGFRNKSAEQIQDESAATGKGVAAGLALAFLLKAGPSAYRTAAPYVLSWALALAPHAPKIVEMFGPPGVNMTPNIGYWREEVVAKSIGGVRSGAKLVVNNIGSTDIDVIGKSGEYIAVGGAAKAVDMAKFGQKLDILRRGAAEAGVKAMAYLAEGTPQKAIDLARKKLGEENVVIFRIVQ